jgi:hypothetical protein
MPILRLPFVLGFMLAGFSVAGLAQVAVTPSNTATTPGPGVIVAVPTQPLVVTPSVALPGSGPAWSSSLPAQPGPPPTPNPSAVSVQTAPVNAEAPEQGTGGNQAAETQNTPAADTGVMNLGAQSFIGSSEPPEPAPSKSLGDVAREYRAQPEHDHAMKMYTNADIVGLDGGSAPAADNGPSPRSPFESPNGVGGNAPGLPASDQAAETEQTAPNGKPHPGRSVRDQVQQELKGKSTPDR